MRRRQALLVSLATLGLSILPKLASAQDSGVAVFNLGVDRREGRFLSTWAITPQVLKVMFAQAGFPVAHIYMNAYDYADIRKFGRDVLDFQCHLELLRVGIQAFMWLDEAQTVRGPEFRTRRDVPRGVVIMASSEAAEAIPQLTWPSELNTQFPWFRSSLQEAPLWTIASTEPSVRSV